MQDRQGTPGAVTALTIGSYKAYVSVSSCAIPNGATGGGGQRVLRHITLVLILASHQYFCLATRCNSKTTLKYYVVSTCNNGALCP